MTAPTQTRLGAMTKGGWFWALLPVAMLLATALGMLVVISIALGDPGFSVEKNYYKKAVDYDRVLIQQQHNSALGWQVTAEVRSFESNSMVIVYLRDRDQRPIIGAALTAEAVALARAQHPDELHFSETAPGVYRARLSRSRPGLWELRLTAQLGSERFTQVLRTEAPPLRTEDHPPEHHP